ncbi:MAG: DUF192 domain-containing protein [Thermomicrobiales bacterium]|nr:DUF192 domain-containing protein [Thermomicrobiales bacterium]MCO5228790.1 DUF192 domain-containing protein [Thermomicrobiales bacterium]
MLKVIAVIVMLFAIWSPIANAEDATLPPWRRPLPEGRQQATILVGDREVTVDLAMTSEQQRLGLGYRNGLDEDHGMLFLGSEPHMKTFWMKGMRFCLDIIWIEDGRIVGAAESVCPDPEGTIDSERQTYLSGVPVTYVLEMDAGWLKAHGYGPGTPVDLSGVPGIPN